MVPSFFAYFERDWLATCVALPTFVTLAMRSFSTLPEFRKSKFLPSLENQEKLLDRATCVALAVCSICSLSGLVTLRPFANSLLHFGARINLIETNHTSMPLGMAGKLRILGNI